MKKQLILEFPIGTELSVKVLNKDEDTIIPCKIIAVSNSGKASAFALFEVANTADKDRKRGKVTLKDQTEKSLEAQAAEALDKLGI